MIPAIRMLGTTLVLGAALTLACGRTGLVEDSPDGGWPADAAAARNDVGTDGDVRDAEAAHDTAPAAVTYGTTCIPGPPTPKSLGVLDDLGSALGLAVSGDRLVVAGVVAQAIELMPRGRFVSIAVSRGDIASQDLDEGIPQGMQAAASALVYLPGKPQAIPDGWSFTYNRVLRWDLQSGERLDLAQPAGFVLADATPLATNAKGEVFWIATGRGESAIAAWHPDTRTTSLSIRAPSIVDVLADDAEVFWKGADETGFITLASTPIAGGAISILYRSSSTNWAGTPSLIGIDSASLYYAFFDPAKPGIVALPKQGGSAATVLPDASPRLPLGLDDKHIYWADEAEANELRRVAKAGGPVEHLWSGPNRWLQAMTLDGCNVYWVVANPFEVFYRGK